jgi:CHASE3 domain-containing protein
VEKQWRDLLLHATIESDPQKMLWLTTELDLRKSQAEAVSKRSGNF